MERKNKLYEVITSSCCSLGQGNSLFTKVFDKRVFSEEILLEKLSKVSSVGEVAGAAAEGFGSYAFIYQDDSKIIAAVDHVRSIPLFYSRNCKGEIYLGGCAEDVGAAANGIYANNETTEEFLLTGFVTGKETLYDGVFQLQAGECLYYDKSTEQITTDFHFRFNHLEPVSFVELELRSRMKVLARQSVVRLINYAEGRQIVVPLSGGHDSRYIALLLKEEGYNNIKTFTYGVKGNKEATVSKSIAETLGLDWLFVEYTEENIRRAWSTPAAKRFSKIASNGVSLPHIQDWYAIYELLNRGDIDPDAIIVPGHSGDFVAGGHIPPIAFSKRSFTTLDVQTQILNMHYSNRPIKSTRLTKKHVLNRIQGGLLKNRSRISNFEYAKEIESWDCRERQAKYIVNSVRSYEYFCLDWYLPLWDRDFVMFWTSIPLILKKNRTWYKQIIDDEYSKYTIAPVKQVNSQGMLSFRKLIRFLVESLPGGFGRATESAMWRALRFFYGRKISQHFLAFGGFLPDRYIVPEGKKSWTLMGMYSELFLTGRWHVEPEKKE